MVCDARHPHPAKWLWCQLEAGHDGNHRCPTVAVGEYVEWPNEKYALDDAIADLAKVQGS